MLPAPQPTKYLLILDCETFYDDVYSLKKMTTPEYILDPRFELQMMAVKVVELSPDPVVAKAQMIIAAQFGTTEHHIIDGPDVPAFLAKLPPEHTTTLSFNSLFDNSILAWRYGWVPHTMLDAMGIARAILGHELQQGVSLRSVANYLHLGNKGHALQDMKGKRRSDIIAEGLWPTFCTYAIQDNYLCEQIFHQLAPQFPPSERRLMDMVLRCTVEPRFQIDKTMLDQHLIDVRAEKELLLQTAGNIPKTTIMSTPKFKAWLESQGVEVEMKTSPTTGKETPCFAKTDEFMENLQQHPDPLVAAAAAARLALKSTLEETRAEKLIRIANLDWSLWAKHLGLPATTCFMPMPLRYGGAHTHRLSGEWQLNVQNMPTVRGSKGKSKLRSSLIVADDEEVVTCDLSQIEARLVAWICGCKALLYEFEIDPLTGKNRDPYSQLATDIFGYPVNRKLKDAAGNDIFAIEGFIGKTGILGLGYAAGKDRFDTMVMQSARKDGLDLTGKYDRAVGDKAVDSYRKKYWEVPRGWQVLNGMLSTAWLSGSHAQKFGPVTISYGNVLLPSGLSLRYADPRTVVEEDGRQGFRYRYGKFTHRIYGAKLLENIVQALARIIVMNAALRIRGRGLSTVNPADYTFRLQAHDELVFIVKKKYLDEAKAMILEEMRRRPSWAPDAPIDAEIGHGASYGAAK